MFRSYHNLAKKSILVLILLGIFFVTSTAYALVPNDPKYSAQEEVWKQIGAVDAWNYTTGSRRVVVATIDTGADIWHDDLKANIWTNPYEIPDNNYDDDNDGYIDDIHGWNFIENSNDVRTSVLDNSGDPDAVNHGTIIAGLIGAIGNNEKSGVGLNWQVSLMPLRAVRSDGNGSYLDVAKAIEYAADHGADVISLSVVGDKNSEGLRDILYKAYQKGIVIVVAAGNDRRKNGGGNLALVPNYPVCMDSSDAENWIVGVSSVDKNDQLSKFADYGPCVDILAPGQSIFSLERFAPMYGYLDEFGGPWQGTSFATPIVAAAAALLKAQRPDWSAKEIISALLKNADNIDDKNLNFVGKLGFGRLNIGRALSYAASSNFPVNYSPWQNYYSQGNIIYITEDGTNYFFASTKDADLISLAASRSFDGKRDEVFALIKRGKHYFVQFFTDQGQRWQEKALPLSDYSATKVPEKIVVVNNDTNRSIQLNFRQKVKQKVKVGKKTVTKTINKTSSKIYNWLGP